MGTSVPGESRYGALDNRRRRLEPWHGHRRVFKRRERRQIDESRRWVYSPRDLSALKDRFRIVSYNILGVENASNHLDLYTGVDPHYLSWERRRKKICKELRHYNAGILCLQEVDRFNDLEKLLQKDGYTGVYKRRTGGAEDGCAVFWKEEQFSLIHQESIEFCKYGLRENVAQLCLFKVGRKHSNASTGEDSDSEIPESMMQQTLLVGNTHVLFNPNRGDIKLGQIRVLLERAHAILQERGNCPVVIAGDLNSLPQSAVYQFLSSSQLNILTYDRKKVSGQIEFPSNQIPFAQIGAFRSLPVVKPKLMTYYWSKEDIFLAAGTSKCTYLQNPLRLSSAYKGVPGDLKIRDQHGEPLATSFHSKFLGTVDYIWHSAGLVPVGVIETLPVNSLRKLRGLPSLKWGSDHLSLVCELAFVDEESS
ncbi:carbon catabolite repressor protein 4 homolog 5 [Dioscorea cayenensis subsp. rotundata]|uniref:Carbon catabolite repressor protein 4 homolog 5 n=1 Tax=Dioscorea cayennensis subsp. rotundata TaxID=55577 RepID=A0AB40BBE5_DIOCR|nr:carbon catabolite repressor protein 4 homolog 5 [Dioscorea cayenensis subsp. rotundata]